MDYLCITPSIPTQRESYKIHYRYRETAYHIAVRRVSEKPENIIHVTVDGTVIDGTGVDEAGRPQVIIPLVDDRREHYIGFENINIPGHHPSNNSQPMHIVLSGSRQTNLY